MGWQDAPIVGAEGQAQPKWASAPIVGEAQPSAQPAPQEQSATGYWKRQAGLAARIPIDAALSIPLMLSDAVIAGKNMIAGTNDPSSSQVYNERLGRVFPTPETGLEKAANVVTGAVLTSKVPIPGIDDVARTVPVTQPSAAQAVIREGEKHGVPVFFDDVTKSAAAKKIGTAAESLPGPFGTGAGREAQNKAAQAAASRVVDSFATQGGDDIPALVQKGLQAKLKQFRKSASTLYGRAAANLDPLGDIDIQSTRQTLESGLRSELSKGSGANQELISSIRTYLQSPEISPAQQQYLGELVDNNVARANFSKLHSLRSRLGDEITEYYTGKNAALGERGVRLLQSAKESLDKDIAVFAKKAGGDAYRSWKAADGFYQANIVPFKEAGFRDLVKTGEPEKAWRYLLAQGGVQSRATRMYNSLDEAGRSAVRSGLVREAMSNASNPNGTFSPAKFAKYMEDNETAVNTFFKGRDLQEIKGFQNLMRSVERAGQYAENPPTGNRLIPYLLGGAAMVEPSVAATVCGTGLTITRLFQTKAGRDLLLMASRARTSKQIEILSNRAAKLLAATSVQASRYSDEAKETEEGR